ncbi:hypothetical protein DFH27DRAFT_330999 [Peziza echinospora]|nr:hypothetical protein DFH27DRAFT_330999 [Peziza echinospora]
MANESASTTASPAALAALTVPKLKEICRSLGLGVGGRKADLISRIEERQRQGAQETQTGPRNKAELQHSPLAIVPAEPRTIADANVEAARITSNVGVSSPPAGAGFIVAREGNGKRKMGELENRTEGSSKKRAEVRKDINSRRLVSKDVGSHETRNSSELAIQPVSSPIDFTQVAAPAAQNIASTVRPTISLPGHNPALPPVTNVQPVISTAIASEESSRTDKPESLGVQKKKNFTQKIVQNSNKVDLGKKLDSVNAPGTLDRMVGLQSRPPIQVLAKPVARSIATHPIQPTIARNPAVNQPLPQITENLVQHNSKKDSKSKFVGRKKLIMNIQKPQQALISALPNTGSTEVQSINIQAYTISDADIKWSPIKYPPRIALRRRTIKISRVLALVAYNTATLTHSAGKCLLQTITLNRSYRYASIQAYSHLCINHEFPGKRTSDWIKAKKVDITIADLREYYWHRSRHRRSRIEYIQENWWGERVWKEFTLANGGLTTDHTAICFQGIDNSILCENEAFGQWDVAARFWAKRFCSKLFSGEIREPGSGMTDALGGGLNTVIEAWPVGINGSTTKCSGGGSVSEIWKILTKDGGVFFIIGGTGEVVGTIFDDSNLLKKGKIAKGMNTKRTDMIIRSQRSTYRRSQGSKHTTNEERNATSTGEIEWKSLRMDWQKYVSQLLGRADDSSGTEPMDLDDRKDVPSILSYLYHPSPSQFVNAIHTSVAQPHHRALAERFVLSHAEAYGFSGGEGNPISGGKRVGLDVDSKWRIESVVCPGEIMRDSRKSRLGKGIGFIQTGEAGWYVLEDTAEVSLSLSCHVHLIFIVADHER